ncbi:hypothetical protein J7413_17500 [Shimia sp. R10_1]|nr:hypothetical protein [Shimia sp. R10_1]
MQFYAVLLAISGVVLLFVLAANILSERTRLKKLEPLLVALSLGIVFWALLTSTPHSASPLPQSSSARPAKMLDWIGR